MLEREVVLSQDQPRRASLPGSFPPHRASQLQPRAVLVHCWPPLCSLEMSAAWTLHAVRRSHIRLKLLSYQRRQLWSLLKWRGSTDATTPTSTAPSESQSPTDAPKERLDRSASIPDALSVPGPVATNGSPYHASQSSNHGVPSLRFLKHGLEISTKAERLFLDYISLRDRCRCTKCIDASTTQRLFQSADIPLNIAPRQAFHRNESLQVLWDHDVPGYDETHVSTYIDLTTLLSNSRQDYNKRATGFEERRRALCLWDAGLKGTANLWHSYSEIMTKPLYLESMLHHLASFGIVFVKDIPESPLSVGAIANRIGGIKKTFYGDTWDVKSVPKAANVAYTSQFLGFHMDLLYMNDPPGLQLLHCLTNTCKGGESMFSDTMKAAHHFRSKRPEDFNILSTFPVSFHYVNDGKSYVATRPTFEVNHIRKAKTVVRYVNWSPPFQDVLRHTQYDAFAEHSPSIDKDGADHWLRKFISASRAFSKEIESERNVLELKLEPGQCVIFNNRRVVHARKGFDDATGERWLRGAYVDYQDFLSTLVSLRNRIEDRNELTGDASSSGESQLRETEGGAGESNWHEVPLSCRVDLKSAGTAHPPAATVQPQAAAVQPPAVQPPAAAVQPPAATVQLSARPANLRSHFPRQESNTPTVRRVASFPELPVNEWRPRIRFSSKHPSSSSSSVGNSRQASNPKSALESANRKKVPHSSHESSTYETASSNTPTQPHWSLTSSEPSLVRSHEGATPIRAPEPSMSMNPGIENSSPPPQDTGWSSPVFGLQSQSQRRRPFGLENTHNANIRASPAWQDISTTDTPSSSASSSSRSNPLFPSTAPRIADKPFYPERILYASNGTEQSSFKGPTFNREPAPVFKKDTDLSSFQQSNSQRIPAATGSQGYFSDDARQAVQERTSIMMEDESITRKREKEQEASVLDDVGLRDFERKVLERLKARQLEGGWT